MLDLRFCKSKPFPYGFLYSRPQGISTRRRMLFLHTSFPCKVMETRSNAKDRNYIFIKDTAAFHRLKTIWVFHIFYSIFLGVCPFLPLHLNKARKKVKTAIRYTDELITKSGNDIQKIL